MSKELNDIMDKANSSEYINSIPDHFLSYLYELPDGIKYKDKLQNLVSRQTYFYNINAQNKKDIFQKSIEGNIYLTLGDKDSDQEKISYLAHLSSFLKKIENILPLSNDQKNKLISAFLLTQDGFASSTRKTGGPAFEHILSVVNNTLKLKNCTFEQVLIALLHDNIEDLPDLDLHEYRFLFGMRTINKVLELSHKPWYHRIGFLPEKERMCMHSEIVDFVNNPENNCSQKTKDFLIRLGPLENNNPHEKLDIYFDTMDPKDADVLRSHLRKHEDENIRNMMHFCEEVSGYRFFAKKLSEDILPIKFADRIHNTQHLFPDPIMSIRSLLETDSYFLEKDGKDTTHVYSRIHQHPIITKEGAQTTHYEVLDKLVDREKDKIKDNLSAQGISFDFDTWYNNAYALYAEKVDLFKKVEANRNNRLAIWGEDEKQTYFNHQEQALENLYDAYIELGNKFEDHLAKFPK